VQYKAFVSSTFEDLKEHRAAVIAALRTGGIQVDPMEDWTASSQEPKVFSQERLEGCHLCILLVAFRRGHVPAGDALSITQLEYEAARKSVLDILAFMLGEDEPWPRRFDELDKDAALKAWRADLREQCGIGAFGLDPKSIQIESALTRWVNEKRAAEPVLSLSARLADLKSRLSALLADFGSRFLDDPLAAIKWAFSQWRRWISRT
jgi:hypothetical protein